MENEDSKIIVGIDLGTTNTLVCYQNKGKQRLIKFPGSGELLPSVIYAEEDGKIIVGHAAKNKGVIDPVNCIHSAKTFMGDKKKTWTLRGKKFTPTDVAVEVLKEARRCIIKKLKAPEDAEIHAVITVPAYFSGMQKEATRDAGERAGFKVIRIISEPMAAAISAVQDMDLDKVFVVDLGGGTFDLSLLEANRNTHEYTALGTDGDRHLGGDNFDDAVYNYLLHQVEEDSGLNLKNQKGSGLSYSEYYQMTGQVREAAEEAKIDLTDSEETDIDLPNLFKLRGEDYTFSSVLTRKEFDTLSKGLYDRINEIVKRFILKEEREGNLDISKISAIILAGGSCYIPHVQDMVRAIFHRDFNADLDLATLVAKGANIVAETDMHGLSSGMVIKDIITHSLGLEVDENGTSVFDKLLLKDDVYPCEKTKTYTTTQDNQHEVDIQVYEASSEGEDSKDLSKQHFYGSLILEGIEDAKAGEPEIDVTFSFDQSQCLTVMAKNKKTGKEKSVRLEKGMEAPVRKAVKPIDFMILLDSSGSMTYTLDTAKDACRALFHDMIDLSIHRIGLANFDNDATLLIGLTNNENSLNRALSGIGAYGGTEITNALRKADSQLSKSGDRMKVVIIVTDGEDFNPTQALNYANGMKNHGIRIIAIGTEGADHSYLKRLASPGDSYRIKDMSGLKETFKTVVQKITTK